MYDKSAAETQGCEDCSVGGDINIGNKLAILGLDWEVVSARNIYDALSSVLPGLGNIQYVKIFRSSTGRIFGVLETRDVNDARMIVEKCSALELEREGSSFMFQAIPGDMNIDFDVIDEARFIHPTRVTNDKGRRSKKPSPPMKSDHNKGVKLSSNDVLDERFNEVFNDDDFHIDTGNPAFKKTGVMKEILRKRNGMKR